MSMFNPGEVFQFAINIEDNGEKFYRKMADKLNDEETKRAFNMLADEEIKHKRTYQGMADKIEKYEPAESYPGEYFEFLRAYAAHIVFDEKELEDKVNQITDRKSAINFGLDIEIASILYYIDMKNLVPENQRTTIDEIINEERRHFTKLSKMKKKIGKSS